MTIDDLLRRLTQGNRGGEEWSEGEGDNGFEWKEERQRRPNWGSARIPKIPVIAAAVVMLVLLCFTGAVDFYTDVLWYRSLGFASVLWRRILPQAVLVVVYTLTAFAVYSLNWRLAIRVGADEFRRTTGSDAELIPERYAVICAAALAFMGGLGSRANWQVVMRFLNRAGFGEVDAIFGNDIGFYIFSLPFLNIILRWAIGLVLTSLVGSVVAFLFCRSLRSDEGKITLIRGARTHILAQVAVFLAMLSIRVWFSRYDLLYSPSGIVYGIGYTDLHVRLPGLAVLSIAVMAAAAMILINLYRPFIRPTVIIVGALLAVGLASLTVLPAIVQGYIVQPNEYEREKEFLAFHINSTRKAFGISEVQTSQVIPSQDVTVEDMADNSETVENIRLWDYGPLLRTYKQLQEIRTYYDFSDVDIDRYKLNGKNRQVMLSIRELDLSQLQNRTWVNSHLEFTHGYGVVMNPVNEMEEGGLPVFFMKDLPPKSTVPISVTKPQIYYGEKPSTYALVKTNVNEFDYPMGDSNIRSTYDGTGGIPIGSLSRRLLFAIKYSDSEILFTDSLTADSRVLLNRNVKDAAGEIAPFLVLEEDIYPIIVDGRILWLQDAYTASSAYPYSRPLSLNAAAQAGLARYSGVNYLRNSVKITVDAYDGSMTFYVADQSDPIIQSWVKIFPGLFKPRDEVPPEIEAHFRYPEEYFEAQSEVYRIYHMTDTNTYYNREDVWMTTPAGQDRRIRPNYVTMQLMDGQEPEFALIAPFMPYGRNNLIGWIAGRSDVGHYGELVVYQFPKQELVFGPPQIEALIDQNTVISSQLSLWSQRGSDVIRGDLLVIPVGKSLLYVQPLYLRAERGELPELKRIILATGGRVAWGETFDEAALELFGRTNTAQAVTPPPNPAEEGWSTESAASPRDEAGSEQSAHDLASEAVLRYEGATRAIQNGDWARYGLELKELGDLLEKIERATGRGR
ncbi:MAG: UPF0182 family protein [Synergistaceae bacterium]|jgi:uncharacterized membrane protein (UPF0182 family)|nr:UPF0182 family protein [Synergistaceae bacterium]